MGVPAFFRWLTRKYPLIISKCIEQKTRYINDVKIPIDTSLKNPNGEEFDNLYLDMNGIIHPCCHPENKPPPKNETEMMMNIFDYIDRIFAIVRPRRLLYMAIDGVAPRAKMNQQRSRRFRAAAESEEKAIQIAKVKDNMRNMGLQVPPDKQTYHFDSNCITPGTEFMYRLAGYLRYYIYYRLNTDSGWKHLTVILSDANVAGEGEHKIMEYIRRQRSQPYYDTNMRHCFCGADADLIMLGLTTHEPYFTIIREEFKPNQPRNCEICCQQGHEMNDCPGYIPNTGTHHRQTIGSDTEFIFIHLNRLRNYLREELTIPNQFEQDLERAIDDWVLMCFFVGNDFLPHIPSLEIHEGAIDRLVSIYKNTVETSKEYLTSSGTVNLKLLQLILTNLGEMESSIFRKRRVTDLKAHQRDTRKNRYAHKFVPGEQFAPVAIGNGPRPLINPHEAIKEARKQATIHSNDADDNVKLWEDGWHHRYYVDKFETDDEVLRRNLAKEYVIGICWVLQYYYQGCPSWDWYFPYYYAPFASDFIDIDNIVIKFAPNTKPLRPLEQLMSVLPAASKEFVPPSWQKLMTDPKSPIIDFYPKTFRVDLNGKKYAWQGVVILPFVDKERLFKALKTVYPSLTDYEQKRNIRSNDRLFTEGDHTAHSFLENLYKNGYSNQRVELNGMVSYGIAGTVWCDKKVISTGATVIPPLKRLDTYPNNRAISVMFQDPQYAPDFIFPARMLVQPTTELDKSRIIYTHRLGFVSLGDYRSKHDTGTSVRIQCITYFVPELIKFNLV